MDGEIADALMGMDALETSARSTTLLLRAGRHAEQGAARGERDPRRVAGGAPTRRADHLGLELYRYVGGVGARDAAGADDERHQRRRARRQLARPAGVHGRARPARRRSPRPADGRRGLPRAEGAAARARPRDGRRRRGRLRAEPGPQRGRDHSSSSRPPSGRATRPASTCPSRSTRRRTRALRRRRARYTLAGEGRVLDSAGMAGYFVDLVDATRSSRSRTAGRGRLGRLAGC